MHRNDTHMHSRTQRLPRTRYVLERLVFIFLKSGLICTNIPTISLMQDVKVIDSNKSYAVSIVPVAQEGWYPGANQTFLFYNCVAVVTLW